MKLAHPLIVSGALSLVTALSLGAAGCRRDETPPTADKPAEVTKPVEAPKPAPADVKDSPEQRRDMSARIMGPPGSAEMMLGAALHDTTLTDAQKTTLQGAADSLRGERGADRDERRVDPEAATKKALAAGVRANKVDVKALPAPAADDAKLTEKRTKQAAALKTLHATLTPDQRKALVETVQKRVDLMGTTEGAVLETDPRAMPDRIKHGDRGMRGSRVMRMLRDASLTDEQKPKIEKALEPIHTADHKAYLAQTEATRNAIKAKLATFATDSFDAAAYVTAASANEKKNTAATLAAEVAAVTPLLTPEQRTRLADKLEK